MDLTVRLTCVKGKVKSDSRFDLIFAKDQMCSKSNFSSSDRRKRLTVVNQNICSNVVYKFTCASCNSCYVGETSRHLSTRIRERLNRDRTSHIFKHLQQSEACRNSCSAECFEVVDRATTKFQVKIKEALHISWEQPSLNKQLYHVNLTLSF